MLWGKMQYPHGFFLSQREKARRKRHRAGHGGHGEQSLFHPAQDQRRQRARKGRKPAARAENTAGNVMAPSTA